MHLFHKLLILYNKVNRLNLHDFDLKFLLNIYSVQHVYILLTNKQTKTTENGNFQRKSPLK